MSPIAEQRGAWRVPCGPRCCARHAQCPVLTLWKEGTLWFPRVGVSWEMELALREKSKLPPTARTQAGEPAAPGLQPLGHLPFPSMPGPRPPQRSAPPPEPEPPPARRGKGRAGADSLIIRGFKTRDARRLEAQKRGPRPDMGVQKSLPVGMTSASPYGWTI